MKKWLPLGAGFILIVAAVASGYFWRHLSWGTGSNWNKAPDEYRVKMEEINELTAGATIIPAEKVKPGTFTKEDKNFESINGGIISYQFDWDIGKNRIKLERWAPSEIDGIFDHGIKLINASPPPDVFSSWDVRYALREVIYDKSSGFEATFKKDNSALRTATRFPPLFIWISAMTGMMLINEYLRLRKNINRGVTM